MLDLSVEPGDPDARLRGPELVVRLELMHGLEQAELDAVLGRLARRWAADDRIAVLVDSLTVKLRPPRLTRRADAFRAMRPLERPVPEAAVSASRLSEATRGEARPLAVS